MKLTRFFLVCMAVFYVGAVITPSTAQAEGWLEWFFPPPKYDPTKTMRAPFANQDQVIEDLDAEGKALIASPLDQKHRTNDVITQWVEFFIPSLLTYKPNEYELEYRKKLGDFSTIGAQEYTKFMQDMNYFTTLKTGIYEISGFIQGDSIILNEGVVDGHYKWVYQADVMLTYMKAGASYSDKSKEKASESVTREYTLIFQLGRSLDAKNEHGLVVETWSVKPRS